METFLFLLELAGTVAFAVSGAVLGIEKHMDIFGVGLLGITTAVGGGILRDLKEFTKVGTNLLEIDEFVHKRIVDRKGAESCYVDYAPDFGTGPFAH